MSNIGVGRRKRRMEKTYHVLEAQTVWVAGRDGGEVLIWQEVGRWHRWDKVVREVEARGVRAVVVVSASGDLLAWGELGWQEGHVWSPLRGWVVEAVEGRRLVKLGETYPEVYAGRGVVAGS